MNEKWVFTNLNAFMSSSFSIQNSNKKFYLAAFDNANNMWVRISDTTESIQEALDSMRQIQRSLLNQSFINVNYHETNSEG